MKTRIFAGFTVAVGGLVAFAFAAALPAAGQEDGKKDPFVKADGKGAVKERDAFKEAAEEARKRVREPERVIAVSSEFIEVPRERWLEAMRDGGVEGRDARALRERVQVWLEEGEANHVSSGMTVTRSGQRSKVESIREFIYPTEFNPAGPFNRFPVAFETLNLGHTLEVDPVLAPAESVTPNPFEEGETEEGGYWIDLNLVPEMVRYAGEYRYGYEPGAFGGEPLVMEPLFKVMKSTTTVQVKDGDYRLLDVFSPTEENGAPAADRKVLSFIKTDVGEIERRPGMEPVGKRLEFALRFEWIEVDANWWGRRLLECGGTELLSGARTAVEEELEAGRAHLTEVVRMPAMAGNRAKSESVMTFSYANDWVPATEPGEHSQRNSCERRHLGVTVEVDPMVGAGGIVELNAVPEIVRHLGENVHQRIERDGKWVPDVTTPSFYTMKWTSSVTMAMGEPMLVAVMAPPDGEGNPDAGRRTLLFVTAE